MGELAPQKGSLRQGVNLEVAYFDQLRVSLDENKSAYENVGQGRDTITVNGKPRNLIGYLEDFLFTSDRINDPVSILSGGERNRLLLARLLARPANVLVMDEPTNDLDIETLELLEDILLEYRGTLLLVSHDRTFLNNLVTSTLVLDGAGGVREYVGGYDDWVRQSQAEEPPRKPVVPLPQRPILERASPSSNTPRKLSFKEQRALEAQKAELDGLPLRIEALEVEQRQLTQAMGDTAFYRQDSGQITQAARRVKEIEEELAQVYLRWEELSGLLE
jgi:ATP-binding cassette subfamily F protein uup